MVVWFGRRKKPFIIYLSIVYQVWTYSSNSRRSSTNRTYSDKDLHLFAIVVWYFVVYHRYYTKKERKTDHQRQQQQPQTSKQCGFLVIHQLSYNANVKMYSQWIVCVLYRLCCFFFFFFFFLLNWCSRRSVCRQTKKSRHIFCVFFFVSINPDSKVCK